MLSFVAHKHVLRVCTPTQQCRPQCLRPLQLRTARLQTHATHATDDDIDWAQLLSIEPTSVVVETPPVTPTQTRGAPLTTAQRRAHRTAAQQLDQVRVCPHTAHMHTTHSHTTHMHTPHHTHTHTRPHPNTAQTLGTNQHGQEWQQ